MSKISTIIFSVFSVFYMFFSIKIVSIKKQEHSKLLNLQLVKEVSDLDFKVQLVFEEIIQIEQTHEFSEYVDSPNSHFNTYKFHQKMKNLFGIFNNLPLDNYMNLGFFNNDNKSLIYSSFNSLGAAFFKNENIDVNKIIVNNEGHASSGSTLFIFKKVNKQNMVWFIAIDLNRNFPTISNQNFVNYELVNKNNNIISKVGSFKEKPAVYHSSTLGTFKYEIMNRLNKDDNIIISLLVLAYSQICLLLYFFNKLIRKNVLSKIINNLDLKKSDAPKNLAINDVTLELNKIIHEKEDIEFMYRSYTKSYHNLLIKEYLMGLNPNLTDLKALFEEFNSQIRVIIVPHEVSIENNENIFPIIANAKNCIFLDFVSGLEVLIIKRNIEKNITTLLKENQILYFISSSFENLHSLKDQWSNLNNAYAKFKMINNQDTESSETDNSDKENQSKMIHFIEENYQNDISLADLAEVINETPKYTSFLFKKYTGVNFKEALTAYRINEAKKMIINNPKIKLTAVASKVGYNSLISFANSFKRQEKIPPSLWRDNLKKS